MSDFMKAISIGRQLSSRLYGGRLGVAFHNVTAGKIILEATQAVYEDIMSLRIPTDIYQISSKHEMWCKYNDLLSSNTFRRNAALNDFFKECVTDVTSTWWEREGDKLSRNAKPIYGIDLTVNAPDVDFGCGSLSRDGKIEDLRWSYNYG